MNRDPLMPHLLDIAADPAAKSLILAGGFGIRLKQQYLQAQGTTSFIQEVPAARATQDLDFFLHMELFVQKKEGKAVRALLNRLSYAEHTPRWQFSKSSGREPEQELGIMVDLLAREPLSTEPVRVKDHRVGSGTGIELHGYKTPEAFAVEDTPLRLPVAGLRSDGVWVEAAVSVPHPYAWLNMKVQAAHDWLRQERGEISIRPFREKHVFDVYILVAMLLENEFAEASRLAARYADNPLASRIQAHAVELFSASAAPGFLETLRQAEGPLDHSLFWQGLQAVLGIPKKAP